MNKNQENYKKAIDQIHADENLKNKVLGEIKIKKKDKKPIYYLKYAVGLVALMIVAVVGVNLWNEQKNEIVLSDESKIINEKEIDEEEQEETIANLGLKKFKNINELKSMLKEQNKKINSGGWSIPLDTYKSAQAESDFSDSNVINRAESFDSQAESTTGDYSKTNNQVENVDEADIVKTDGKYIYYSQNDRVYIVDTDLELKSTIQDKNFSPRQIFVKENKLVVLGTKYNSNDVVIYHDIENENKEAYYDRVSSINRPKSVVKIFDLRNIERPKLKREVEIDGNYQDARMIGNDVYLVTNYSLYYYDIDNLRDIDLLPTYKDSLSSKNKYVDISDIYYFDDLKNYCYSLIAGIDLDFKRNVNVETFFGASEDMYVSENNMYIINSDYSSNDTKIYKFKLENAKVTAVTSGRVKGYINNQFSLDEYKGNLRIATTEYPSYRNRFFDIEDYEVTSTHLTILDENLDKIGEIEDLIKDEKIYAVRFIGKIGYVVTFEEIDPLWVIDLSNPRKPVVKGQLEIPGYSSYLHPYDETHIIGIGYNVKDNGYGGIINDTIKISMFDVSDLNNPKELFSNNLNSKGAYSSIMNEHKALFFNKAQNLIGFPIDVWERKANKTGLLLYRIDFDNKRFEEIKELVEKTGFYSMERAIYIDNYIYTLYMDKIIKYDMNNFEKIEALKLDYDEPVDFEYDVEY